MKLSELVDPFHGNFEIDLPKAEGIAAAWFWPKAQTGNTHPGACLPFGWVSVCAYSGAYITGYGPYAPNSHGAPKKIHDEHVACGFSHFQQSGTGNIKRFYNYLRACPQKSDAPLGEISFWPIEDEKATPGHYSCRMGDKGVKAELTVTPRTALHRYRFDKPGGWTVSIDACAGGLFVPDYDTRPTELEISVDGSKACGSIVVEDVTLYFAISSPCGEEFFIWQNGSRIEDKSIKLNSEKIEGIGLGVSVPEDASELELQFGFSMKNCERAKAHLISSEPFETTKNTAQATWQKHLDSIEVESSDKTLCEIFASNLYHALKKPVDCTEDGPAFLPDDKACYLDFATLWDQYKTSIPLAMTLFPERGSDMVNALIGAAEVNSRFPNGLLMANDFMICDKQSSMLAHMVIHSAFVRNLPGIDWQHALELMAKDFDTGRGPEFCKGGTDFPSATHMLDMAQAAHCTAEIAEALNDKATAERMHELSHKWTAAFDKTTGVMVEGNYYEGSNWTYSFRPFHDMAKRIELAGGSERFMELLDSFFGFGAPPVEQPGDDPQDDFMEAGIGMHTFEALNNEPDMETPLAYHYIDRPDRACEVVRAVQTYQFTTGRGGLPGNDDSGGLSGWYIWSMLGLMPIMGTDKIGLLAPRFDKVSMPWLGKKLTIIRNGPAAAVAPKQISLNGKVLDERLVSCNQLADGGVLEFEF